MFVIINLFASIALFITYYFAFDIQWGISKSAITWGIPTLIASLITLAAGLYTWKTKVSRWGFSGLAVAAIAAIYTSIILCSFSYVLLPSNNEIEQEETNIVEHSILKLVLSDISDNNKGNHYIVVTPETASPSFEYTTIKEYLAKYNYDFTYLIELFSEKNQLKNRLSINSSIDNGYYIDYDAIFSRYFDNSGNGYLRTNIFRPQVSKFVEVSLPAYDSTTGYVLIYVGETNNSTNQFGGSGSIYVYKYLDGKLNYIDIVPIWIK
jgi:hypothetical protein